MKLHNSIFLGFLGLSVISGVRDARAAAICEYDNNPLCFCDIDVDGDGFFNRSTDLNYIERYLAIGSAKTVVPPTAKPEAIAREGEIKANVITVISKRDTTGHLLFDIDGNGRVRAGSDINLFLRTTSGLTPDGSRSFSSPRQKEYLYRSIQLFFACPIKNDLGSIPPTP